MFCLRKYGQLQTGEKKKIKAVRANGLVIVVEVNRVGMEIAIDLLLCLVEIKIGGGKKEWTGKTSTRL